MKRKKIFFLINSMEWWWAERVISIISSELSKKYNVDLITLKNINFYEFSKWVNYIPLSNIKNNFLMFLLIPYYVYKFKKLHKNNSYKSWVSFLEISNFVNILANKNAIISFRISIDYFQWLVWYIYKKLIKQLYPKAKKIIVNSEENKYDLAKYLKIDLNKIKTIYNPIDIEKIEKLKNEKIDTELTSKVKDKKVFITVWRLVWQKNHKKIISAFTNINDKSWIYLIIWDWPEKLVLENMVSNLWFSDNIIFLWEQKNVFKYLNISDYFIYASTFEWFPNALLESIICWVPIITSDFKSWARECIIWKYDINLKNIKYPYHWENWVLLDLNYYEKNFLEIYNNLNNVKQKKVWIDNFNIKNIKTKFREFI